MKCLNTRTTQYNKMPNYITNSNLRLPNQEVANKRQKVLTRMYLSFLKHSTNTSPHVWKERHINNNMKLNIKNKSKLTLPLSQIHQKVFIFFQLPLNKTNRIPTDSHLNLSPPFCHVLTKTTQSEGRQKTYAIENKRKQRIKRTQNNSTLQKIETTSPMNNTG